MDKYSKLNSFLRGLANTGTLGFGDEVVGGIKALKDVATTDKELKDVPELYTQHRDKYRDVSKEMEHENPKSYMAGEATGGLATMALPGSAIAAPTLARAMATGAAYGGATGLGMSEADNASDMALDTAKGAGLGAAAAPVAYGAGKAFSALKGALGSKLPVLPEKMVPVSGAKQTPAFGSELTELAGELRNNRIAGQKTPDELMASYKRKMADKVLLPSDKAAEEMAKTAEERAAMLSNRPEEVTQTITEAMPSKNTNIINEESLPSLAEILEQLKNKY